MTKLFDDPARFSDDMLAGFLDAHAGRVTGVPGGVVRATETPPGKVALVVGGGSGHYPAFCGLVGPGFADAAVVGNVFTSPSAQEAYEVGRAAAGTAGLLFSTGKRGGEAAYQVADLHALRGEADLAFEWLERAYDQRDAGIGWTMVDPFLRSLHADPRWDVFLRKLGLAD